jgi:hypothetical protein
VAFWYELLRSKFKLSISPVTKIISICSATLMMVGLIPGLYLMFRDQVVIGIAFIVIPIMINSLFLFIVTCLINNFKQENISDKNQSKKQWVVKTLFALSGSWGLFIFSLFLTIVLSDYPENFRIIPQIFLSTSYFLIPISISAVIDHKFESIRKYIV